MTGCDRVAVARLRRAVAGAWEGLSPGERALLVRAAALALARCPADPEGLLWYAHHTEAAFARMAWGHAAGCDDPGCDAAVCRAARGLPPRADEELRRGRSVRLPGKVPRGERHR